MRFVTDTDISTLRAIARGQSNISSHYMLHLEMMGLALDGPAGPHLTPAGNRTLAANPDYKRELAPIQFEELDFEEADFEESLELEALPEAEEIEVLEAEIGQPADEPLLPAIVSPEAGGLPAMP